MRCCMGFWGIDCWGFLVRRRGGGVGKVMEWREREKVYRENCGISWV